MRAFVFVNISICVECFKNICCHANFEKEGAFRVFKSGSWVMALPHVNEISGTDRASDDELELPPEHDGNYKFNVQIMDLLIVGVARKLPDGWERAETPQNVPYYVRSVLITCSVNVRDSLRAAWP